MKNLTFFLFIMLTTGCGGQGYTGNEETAENPSQNTPDKLIGAWEINIPTDSGNVKGVSIITENHFSTSIFMPEKKQFVGTTGGSWSLEDENQLVQVYEYYTTDTTLVGDTTRYAFTFIGKDSLQFDDDDSVWKRIDDGTPGRLAGAWLITGRQQGGEVSRRVPGPRKTMKILSGTRFQWVAYNTETGGFFGTGGGTYTTGDSTYTEKIGFFSRDSSRVGASLEFQYKLDSGEWHHSGLSSKGDPIYEIWTPRDMLDSLEAAE